MPIRGPFIPSLVVASLLSLGTAPAASSTSWQLTAGCAFSGIGGDLLDHGFYLSHYTGSNLSEVELGYTESDLAAGSWSITLTARRGSFDGPIIGTTQIATPFNVPDLSTNSEIRIVFDFGGAPVTPGDTITFTQTAQELGIVNAGDSLFFDTGTGPCSNVFETNDTTHGLAPTQRDTVGILVTEHTPPISCVASDTVMCIDDSPGDQRFKATVTFHTVQGGGSSGNGNEIPMAPLGVSHGGLFWFFGPDNPEMLVKILNGCAINGRYWVFISAGTNVGYSITITDTAFGASHTYTNMDLTPALPVQDTSTLDGCS